MKMSDLITLEVLRAGTGCNAERAAAWLQPLRDTCTLFGIDTPPRVAPFVAQLGHESGGLRYVREIWGPTPAQVRYEGRKDLGNTQPGDGKRYMGRGLIQMTGRSNYGQVRDELRKIMANVPDFAADPVALEQAPWAALSAGWFWDSRKLNALADQNEFITITRRINGGLNGLADRQRLLADAQKALGVVWTS
ncbi:glycoside hydrolase [Pigmentiphaga litoralis]|uniref:glycoside hydrolase family 19 protein n=1 Tax=Pigmentiphaga litoralis TaxID=516702 RepID=UPI001679D8AC|nr:glycoside hydrolase family 19 protein [Pigmentiphaga litoralis]GGX11056.1 glycoside hydrolase [Pigmentiphaga litoralis]